MTIEVIQFYILILGIPVGLICSFLILIVFFAIAEMLQGGSFIATIQYCWKHW